MPITMYQASVPGFIRLLGSLKSILEKAAAHAAAKKIDDSVFVNSRLFPDMLPLSFQVQVASDFARGTCARLAGTEPPAVEDKEKTLAELIARVDASIAYVKTFTAAQIDGSETRQITRKIRGNPVDVHRTRLPAQVRSAQFLFSRDDHLRDPAPQRRRDRQGRLPRTFASAAER